MRALHPTEIFIDIVDFKAVWAKTVGLSSPQYTFNILFLIAFVDVQLSKLLLCRLSVCAGVADATNTFIDMCVQMCLHLANIATVYNVQTEGENRATNNCDDNGDEDTRPQAQCS